MFCHVPPRRAPLRRPRRRSVRPYPACRSSIAFRSRRRRFACGGSLFRAYRMCARAHVSRRRAYRAPECAHAPAGQAQGARLLSVPLGSFCAGAKRPPDAACFCPILAHIFICQIFSGMISVFMNKLRSSIMGRCSCWGGNRPGSYRFIQAAPVYGSRKAPPHRCPGPRSGASRRRGIACRERSRIVADAPSGTTGEPPPSIRCAVERHRPLGVCAAEVVAADCWRRAVKDAAAWH